HACVTAAFGIPEVNEYLTRNDDDNDPFAEGESDHLISDPPDWSLPNVHLGVSVESQEHVGRVEDLRRCPAAIRFVSAEPLLGPVDLSEHMWPLHWRWDGKYKSPEDARAAGAFAEQHRQALVSAHAHFLDWVIVGGESGRGARPCAVAWIRSIVEQCKAAGVACFVKQLGAVPVVNEQEWRAGATGRLLSATMSKWAPEGFVALAMGDRKGGDMAEFPEDLRVREFPRAL
ncbi:MAG: DUF5131 family protein, partial [Pseudomonadota bacterium]